jgi:hypothetical protein
MEFLLVRALSCLGIRVPALSCLGMAYIQRLQPGHPRQQQVSWRMPTGHGKHTHFSFGPAVQRCFVEAKASWQYLLHLHFLCAFCGRPGSDGIDRIDNAPVYSTDTVQACCTLCDQMKSDHEDQDFKDRCAAIAQVDARPPLCTHPGVQQALCQRPHGRPAGAQERRGDAGRRQRKDLHEWRWTCQRSCPNDTCIGHNPPRPIRAQQRLNEPAMENDTESRYFTPGDGAMGVLKGSSSTAALPCCKASPPCRAIA